MKKNTMAGS